MRSIAPSLPLLVYYVRGAVSTRSASDGLVRKVLVTYLDLFNGQVQLWDRRWREVGPSMYRKQGVMFALKKMDGTCYVRKATSDVSENGHGRILLFVCFVHRGGYMSDIASLLVHVSQLSLKEKTRTYQHLSVPQIVRLAACLWRFNCPRVTIQQVPGNQTL
ncbi:uncharacterized protein B0T23DRAFT_390058, partial [Neurospora hispaniola]